jgi:outer membrane protein OmpA-like peptidoglycan-associated protein
VATWLGWGAMALLAGCSHETAPPRAPSLAASSAAPAPQGEPAKTANARDERETTIQVSDAILRECHLPTGPTEVPRFDLDQASLHPRGRNILDDVANCMKDGPLQHRTITLVGRADPRGSDQHNQALAGSRAEAARKYLVQKGVVDKKLLVISRGEQSAQGDDEASWALDRRVDLELGDRTERTNISQNPAANAEKAAAKPGSAYADQIEGGGVSGKATGSSGPGSDGVTGK